MLANHADLSALFRTALARIFHAADGVGREREACALERWEPVGCRTIARRRQLPGVPGDLTLWRIVHAPPDGAADRPCMVTQDDRAEFAILRGQARSRAIATRTLLRRALSNAVDDDVSPLAWKFARSELGKPHVVGGPSMVHFSTTHTPHASLIATSRHSNVGLDAECMGLSQWEAIAGTMFSRRERGMLNAAPNHRREEAFYRLWTAKEARAKLVGVGLAYALPGNDCGVGTRLATWVDEDPSMRMVVSLAVHDQALHDRKERRVDN